jgi:hypothetical protein
VSNRIGRYQLTPQLSDLVQESLLGLLSNQASLAQPRVWRLLKDVCDNCDLGLTTLVRLTGELLVGGRQTSRRLMATRVKRISVKPFMDVSTMIEERLVQCCVHVGTVRDDDDAEQHQCAPFCAVQAWPALSQQKLSMRVANSLPLIPAEVSP